MNTTIEEIRDELERLRNAGAFDAAAVNVQLWTLNHSPDHNVWWVSWFPGGGSVCEQSRFRNIAEVVDFMREKWGSFPGRVAVGDGLVEQVVRPDLTDEQRDVMTCNDSDGM